MPNLPFTPKVCLDKLRPLEVFVSIEPIWWPNILQISNFVHKLEFIKWIKIGRDNGFKVLGGRDDEGKERATIKNALLEIWK